MSHNSSFSMLKCLSSPEPKPVSIMSCLLHVVLVYPPSLYALLLAFRQWRRPRSSAKATSHVDFFTLHMISLQLLLALGMSVYFAGYFSGDVPLVHAGFYCATLLHGLEVLVHCFTSVDRYLAVVHPVAYLKLKSANGDRVRNAAMAGAWLLCSGYVTAMSFNPDHVTVSLIGLLGVGLGVICFCSVSVLCVLVRPGPSDAEKVDRSKRKALDTITAIMAVLLFWLVGILVCLVLQHAAFLSNVERCFAFMSTLMFNIPSELVLPLLYLKRRGKIPCWRKSGKKERNKA